MLQVKRLTDAIGDELNDLEVGFEHTRWPLAQLFEYITEAMEQIASLKPEVFARTQTLRLQQGAAQSVPLSFTKLIDVRSNVNADGSMGDPVLPSNYTLLRNFNKPSCSGRVGSVGSFSIHPDNPRTFYVSPPASAYPPQFVEVIGSVAPPLIGSVNNVIEFPGADASTYFNAIKDWALYRAFMKDTESQSSLARSTQHYRAFYQFLNVKLQVDTMSTNRQKSQAMQGGQGE